MNWMKKNWFWIVLTLISIFRIYLAANTNYAVIAGKFDDELAIHWGYSLIEGEWLGEYSYTTLIKGITYPCFIALLKLIGLTYGQGLGIVMVASSLIFIGCLQKINKNKIFLLIAFVFALFNPAGFSGWTALHIYRDVLTMWLLLILFSSVIAVYLNRKLPWKKSIVWIFLGGGISYPALFYLREDTIWLYTFTILSFFICAVIHYYFNGKEKHKWRGIKTMLFTSYPWICVGVVGLLISGINYHYYGVFTVNDRTQGAFAEMMELIYQVQDDETDEDAWITDEMLGKCMDASASLGTVREEIENRIEVASEEDGQIHGDLLQWELRTALRDAGYYQDAVETEQFLEQVVNELQDAYESGLLQKDKKIHLSAQGRGMTIKELISYIPVSLKNFYRMSAYEGCYSYYPYYPQAKEDLVKKFEVMLSTPLSQEYIDNPYYVFTEKVYHFIGGIYQKTGKMLLVISCMVWAVAGCGEIFRYKRRKEISIELGVCLPAAGISLSGLLLIYMITVFTTFLSVYNFYNYITGIYAIYTIFEVLALNYLWKEFVRIKGKIECRK